jgi:hypothetical protein
VKNLLSGFKASIEELGSADQELSVVSAPGEMETAVAVVDELSNDVDCSVAETEVLAEAAQGLESLLAASESALAYGGLDSASAGMMHVAVESIYERVAPYGVGLAQTATPSIEFGATTDRRVSTEAGVEELKANIKKLWEAVKAAAMKAWDAAVALFGKVFNTTTSIANRAKALSEAKVEGKADGKVTVSDGLVYDGKFDIGSIKKGLDASAKHAELLATTAPIALKKVYEKTKADGVLDLADVTALGLKATDLPGGRKFEPTETNWLAVTKTPTKGGDIDVPSVNDIHAIGNAAVKIANVLQDKKNLSKDLATERDDVIEWLNAETAKGKLDGVEATAAKLTMRIFRHAVESNIMRALADELKVASAAVQFGERALKKYSTTRVEDKSTKALPAT